MASYTRQSTFSDGDLITAALFNDEYNQLLAAFENTTGHKHDGTVGEGPVIGILGDAGVVTPLNKILIDTTNDHIEFWIDVSGTSTQQLYIADGAIVPVTDNDIDLGTSSLQFKDLYINGTANIDSLVADTADINGGTIDGTIIGGTSAAAITGTTITGTSFVIGSASIDETELEILDGATLTTTELNYVDGVTSSIQTQIDTKAPLASPNLTGIPTAPTAASNTNTTQIATTAYVQTEITELIAGAPGTLDTLNELAAAINDDANYNTTLTTALATKLPLAGGTMTGDVTYSDNVKAQFGTSNDLQIFHDGNDKIVSSSSYLLLEGSNIILRNNGGTEDYAKFFGNSAVELYYDNSKKLATTSTGVDVTGTITADGLTVDDITINGSTISDGGSITIDTEGDFIVDSEGDVYLDAAGNDWNLNSAGTNVLKVTNTSGDISVKSMTSDKDLIFKGVDGGSTVTALTLDMSDAGTAIFNHDIKVGDNSKAIFGAGSDLQIYHDGSNSFIKDSGTGSLLIDATNLYLRNSSGEEYASFISDGAANLKYNGSTRIVTTSTGINVTGIVENDGLRVDSTDSIRPTGDTSLITISGGNATNSGANYSLFGGTHATLANIHRWRIGGSEAARIDSSGKLLVGKTAASIATVGVELRPNGQLFATQSANYPLLLNRTTSDGDIIQLRKDNTTIGNIGSFSAAGNSYLTIGSGDTGLLVNSISDALQPWNISTNAGRDAAIDLGATSGRFKDLHLSGTANFGSLSDGTITITGFADEDDMSSNSATLVPTQQSVKAYVDSQVSSAGGTGISFADDEKAKFGDGLDLEIYHDGSNSFIKDVGTGDLIIQGSNAIRLRSSTGENMAIFNADGAATLQYDNSTKLQTSSTGIDVTGVITTDGLTTSADINFGDDDKAVFGAGSDLQIYHTSADNSSYIRELGAGNLKILGDNVQILNAAGTENQIFSASDGGVYLYHNGVAKFETTSTGIDVTGTVTSDGLSVAGVATIGADTGGEANVLTLKGRTSDNDGYIKFTSSDGATAYAYVGVPSANTLSFYTNGYSEAARIDSSGNFMVGGTNARPAEFNHPKGISFRGDIGQIQASTDANIPLLLNRDTSDGTIVDFRKDGTTVGVIGSQNWGIGTSSPSSNLHIKTSVDNSLSQGLVIERSANTDKGYINYQGGAFQFRSTVGDPIAFGDTSNEYVRIANGNVGIGTSSPSEDFHISGDTSVALIEGTNTSTSGLVAGVKVKAQFYRRAGFSILDESDNEDFFIGRPYGAALPVLVINTDGSERARIDSSGNFLVGGTTTPDTNGISIETSASSGGLSIISPTTGRGDIFFGDTADLNIGQIRYAHSDNSMTFRTNAADRVVIDSSGNLGIGTSSPDANLEIDKGSEGEYLRVGGDNASNARSLRFTSSTASGSSVGALHTIKANSVGGEIAFANGNGNIMYLNVDRNVGIGTTSPSAKLHVFTDTGKDFKVDHGTDNRTILSTDRGLIVKAGGGYALDLDTGSTNGIIRFLNNNNEALRFDASGNFMVGKTSVGVSTTGSEIRADGQVSIVREYATPLYINRKSSDGNVADFRKDNSTFGTISNSGTNLIISGYGTNKSGLYFGDNALFPVKNGSLSNSTIGFGSPNYRFTDLYLSGTANVNKVSVDGSGANGIDLEADSSATTNSNRLFFSTSAGSNSIMGVSGALTFRTGATAGSASGTERLRLDSSGNLLVGTTTVSLYNNSSEVGTRIGDGVLMVNRSANTPAYFNRLSTDGTIVDFRKDGSTVGSIGTVAGATYYGGVSKSLRMNTTGFHPADNTGAYSDDTVSLGHSGGRFKDLYLSGQANVGSVLATGNVTAFSDERLKDNIETLQGSKVLDMRGVSFTKDGEASSGVIAQEIEKVAPELVHTAKDEMGTKSVAYGNLVGYLIEAIKDQQKQIDDLKERLDNGTS